MKSGKAWLIAIVAIFATLGIACSQFKVTATMVYIIDDWGISLATAGLLMSVPSLAAMIVALPGGAVLQKLGSRKTLLAVLALGIVSNAAGALSPNFTLMAVSRFFEGLCLGMITIVTPAIIAQSFPAEKRGLPMALFSLWVSIGMLCILNICNFVTPLYGWQANWWVVTAILCVGLVLSALFVKLPGPGSGAPMPDEGMGPEGASPEKPKWSKGARAAGPWLLAIVFFVYSVGLAAYNSYFPTYLAQAFQMDPAAANNVMSASTIVMIVVGILFGVVLNRVPNKHHSKILVVAAVLYAIAMVVQFNLPSAELALPAVVFIGFASQLVAPLIYDVLPDTIDPSVMSVGMSIVAFGSGIGSVLATIICGLFVEAFGSWSSLALPLGVFGAIAVVAAVVVLIVQKRRAGASA